MSAEDQILERLTHLEEKLARLEALEARLTPLFGSWENGQDLGRDLALLMDPTVRLLTQELAEVETGFQLKDALALVKRLLLSFRNLAWSLEQLENVIDWWHDLEPVFKIAVPHFNDLLDSLEQQGNFRINRAMLNVVGKLAASYSAEDIEAIGDGFVRMHGLVKQFSNPVLFEVLEKLAAVPSRVDLAAVKPVGPMGLAWKMRSKECRQGLGLLLELTRALGRVGLETQAGSDGPPVPSTNGGPPSEIDQGGG